MKNSIKNSVYILSLLGVFLASFSAHCMDILDIPKEEDIVVAKHQEITVGDKSSLVHITALNHDNSILFIAFKNGTSYFVDLLTQKKKKMFAYKNLTITAAVFHPIMGSLYIASYSESSQKRFLHLWDTESRKLVSSQEQNSDSPIRALAFSQGAVFLATGYADGVVTVELVPQDQPDASAQILQLQEEPYKYEKTGDILLALSESSESSESGNSPKKKVQVQKKQSKNTDNSQNSSKSSGHESYSEDSSKSEEYNSTLKIGNQPISSLCSSGYYLLIQSNDGKVSCFNALQKKIDKEFIGTFCSFGFNFGGSLIGIGSKDGTVILWDKDENKSKSFSVYNEPVRSLAFVKKHYNLMATGSSSNLSFWDCKSLKKLLEIAVDEPIEEIIFIANKSLVLTISNKGTVTYYYIGSLIKWVTEAISLEEAELLSLIEKEKSVDTKTEDVSKENASKQPAKKQSYDPNADSGPCMIQ